MKSSTPKRSTLKPSTRNQAQGKVREVTGKVKEKAGRITNDPDMETEGKIERVRGSVQKKVGQIGKVFGN